MLQLSEFRNKELAFFEKNRELIPMRGYQTGNSENYNQLKKIRKEKREYLGVD